MAEIREALLLVQRQRIVDLSAHATALEMRAQLVASLRSNHVLVEDVAIAGLAERQADCVAEIGRREQRVVMIGVALPRLAPRVEMLELDAQHRRLELVQAEIAADQSVEVFRLAAV